MKKLIVIAIAIFGFSAVSFGQSSATATATATLIVPISISHSGGTDLVFGTIGASATAGTVTIDPAGARSASTGMKLIGTGTTAAVFTVTGEPLATYAITLPTVPYSLTNGSQTMNITAFSSTPSATGALAATTGVQTLSVGATLGVGINQVAGTYTGTAPFTVTVNYN